MRQISEIIVHCTATRPEWLAGKAVKAKVAEIDKWHKGNGWKGIGYHYVIDRDGSLGVGRDLNTVGAHVKDHNIGTIGVALVGGFGAEATDAFSDHFTPEQDATLRKFISDMRVKFGDLKLSGHNEYAAKGCPGFYVPDWAANKQKPAPSRPLPEIPPQPTPEAPWGAILREIVKALTYILGLFRRK